MPFNHSIECTIIARCLLCPWQRTSKGRKYEFDKSQGTVAEKETMPE
jgi:hypothetical protein